MRTKFRAKRQDGAANPSPEGAAYYSPGRKSGVSPPKGEPSPVGTADSSPFSLRIGDHAMKHQMKDKTSESHDEVMRRRLRANPKFAAEYLRAALEETEEPAV